MKVVNGQFTRFLDLIRLKGDVEIPAIKLYGDKQKVVVFANPPVPVLMVRAVLNVKGLEGLYGIGDFSLFRKTLDVFGKDSEIDIVPKSNKFEIKSGKTVARLVLTNPEYVAEQKVTPEKFEEFDKEFTDDVSVSKEDLSKLKTYFLKLGAQKIVLKCKNSTISATLDNNDNSILYSFEVNKQAKDFEIVLNKFFGNVLDVILANTESDIYKISVKDNFRFVVEEKDIKVTYIIAPIKA